MPMATNAPIPISAKPALPDLHSTVKAPLATKRSPKRYKPHVRMANWQTSLHPLRNCYSPTLTQSQPYCHPSAPQFLPKSVVGACRIVHLDPCPKLTRVILHIGRSKLQARVHHATIHDARAVIASSKDRNSEATITAQRSCAPQTSHSSRYSQNEMALSSKLHALGSMQPIATNTRRHSPPLKLNTRRCNLGRCKSSSSVAPGSKLHASSSTRRFPSRRTRPPSNQSSSCNRSQ